MSEAIPTQAEAVVTEVRERYGKIAAGEIAGCGCGCGPDHAEEAMALGIGYQGDELAELPPEANLGLGCGAPIAPLAPQAGETVVDLGSGAGIDAFLAARLVGPTGRVIGVDMTPAMLERARGAAVRNGFTNVEFREGRLEALPIDDASVDAVTSNCVFNLVPDKAAVFREVARVLKPGGRLVVSDIVLDRALPGPLANDLLAWVGCVAGAELRSVYFAKLADAGLTELELLKDIDYAQALLDTAPDEARALLGRFGMKAEDVLGAVRSITYRARRPAETKSCCGPSCCSAA